MAVAVTTGSIWRKKTPLSPLNPSHRCRNFRWTIRWFREGTKDASTMQASERHIGQ